ncbi:hypothetical protein CHO01_22850 [Cellulomonas hominis]|uniref:Uncharacterized protein n=1 Tax=Cellulomonas hominis TaxID=156981 RepID=A0A511FD26_9CELL|nr:hypothetical protein [Cellulomonas hominis]MBB5474615.1 hypothetical protein [Cellulomonas hominis]NKY05488.1 hypothetical protein [Cellulomonas hominis]GEL47169.1 hypothetical protein CHO01_22850 [Cellulomonas hominis]
MSTRTLAQIRLDINEPDTITEDVTFTLNTGGDTEPLDVDSALEYAQQIDAMAGDSPVVEVAILTALHERQVARIAAAQAQAEQTAARLAGLGAKPKSRARRTRAPKPETVTTAEAPLAEPAPPSEQEPAGDLVPTVDSTPGVAAAAPAAETVDGASTPEPPAEPIQDEEVPPAEAPLRDDPEEPGLAPVADIAPPAPQVATFIVPRGPDGAEDISEF